MFPIKWSNTLKQSVGKLPTNCLSVFDHFVKLALKGLKWYYRIKAFVLTNGGKVWEIDPSMFTRHENNSLNGVIIVHVDDFLFAGNEKFQNTVIANLQQTFAIGKEKSKQFNYLSLKLCYWEDKITIDQKEYIKNVNIEGHIRHNLSEPLLNNMKDILRQEVTQLL